MGLASSLLGGEGGAVSWDGLQREALDALGFTLWRRVDAAASVPDDPLLHALLRAAGRGADAPDAASLCRGWMPLARLRTPEAKRALWPQLRALRSRAVS
ncbi:hypothetical protein U3649_06450 [Luteimonas sp. R10]|nr:hypothetical protein U3649_06450 [Luteimonas sp. R10]